MRYGLVEIYQKIQIKKLHTNSCLSGYLASLQKEPKPGSDCVVKHCLCGLCGNMQTTANLFPYKTS